MFFESFMINLSIIVVLVFALTYDYVTKFFSYWYVRHIPNKTPISFFGTDYHRVLGIRSTTDEVNTLYEQYPDEKFVGSIKSRIPDLVVRDPDAIKTILSTDFASFHRRGLTLDKSQDVCIRNNLFYADGEKWTLLREGLETLLRKLEGNFEDSLHDCLCNMTNGDTNVQDLLSKVLDDVFKDLLLQNSSDCTVIKNIRSAVQKRTFMEKFKTYLKHIFPSLYSLFRMVTIPGEPTTKTKKALVDSKLLKIIKEGSIYQFSLNEKGRPNDVDFAFSALANFITEGYVPCHTLLTAVLFDLAKNNNAQKLAKESEDYLNAAIKESLRLHPPYSVITRQCVKMYHYPDRDLVIDKNVTVNFPVEAIHKDEKYYKDATTYNPERFLTADNPTHSFAYLPFGAGPRKCIGEQLAMKIACSVTRAVIKNYELETCDKTPALLTMADHNFGRVVDTAVWLKFKPIKSY